MLSELSEATGSKPASRVCAPNSQATLSVTFLACDRCVGKDPLPSSPRSHASVIVNSIAPKR